MMQAAVIACRGFVADMLIAFGVLEVDVIVDNNGLRVLGEQIYTLIQARYLVRNWIVAVPTLVVSATSCKTLFAFQ